MKKIASIGIFAIFISVLFTSLFAMPVGMDMEGGMSDCPFMEVGEVICPMDFADHIGAWKAAFVSIVPNIFILIAAGAVLLLTVSAPVLFGNKGKPIPVRLHISPPQTYSHICRPLQELFSKGILHPKLF